MTFAVMGYNASEVILSSSERHEEAERSSTIRSQGTGTWSLMIQGPNAFLASVSQRQASWKTSHLQYTIALNRKATYYGLRIFVPVVLIWMVNICAVILPANSGERISLLVTCFLAEIVYLDTVFNTLPETSDYVPQVVLLVLLLLFFSGLQILFACLTSNVAGRQETTWPKSKRIQKLISVVKKLLCLESIIPKKNSKTTQEASFQEENSKEIDSTELEVMEAPRAAKETSMDAEATQQKSFVVQIIDRITVIVSVALVVVVPTFIALIYNKIVKVRC